MSEETLGSASASAPLPDTANFDWLRKHAKRRLRALRRANPAAKLADAQFDLATQYGFSSWRALKAHVDSLTIDGQLVDSARTGDVNRLATLLDANPEKLRLRIKPYEWTLLHAAAQNGQLAVVDLLLRRGLNVNTREKGDNTYAMHWAAAAAHLDVVRRLADAGGDVIGQGDDHALEVIGWATCWDGCDDAAHRAVAEFLVSRGARHHIFSAVALQLDAEVRRIVHADPATLVRSMSHNEDFQRPLHFAVRKNLPDMVSLLLELGADPLVTDASGYTVAAYATHPDIDRAVMEATRFRGAMNLVTAVALHEWETASRLMHVTPNANDRGALHLMAKRGDVAAVKWLLDHGANPNALWSHWDADVTPIHLAAWQGHADVVRLLLDAGADPNIRDSKHDGDAMGWAEFAKQPEIVRILNEHASS